MKTQAVVSVCLALVLLASAQPVPQCLEGSWITSPDTLSNYSLSAIQNQKYSFKFDNNGTPTTIRLSLCSPKHCQSQCAVQTFASTGSQCFGICDVTSTVMALDNYQGLMLNYTTVAGYSTQVSLTCNPKLDENEVVITKAMQALNLLSVVGEIYCASLPLPWTVVEVYFGRGVRCGNWDIYNTIQYYNSTCTSGCAGDNNGSIMTQCWPNRN